jgi:hypothetical protein
LQVWVKPTVRVETVAWSVVLVTHGANPNA